VTSLEYLAKYNHLLGNNIEAVRLGTEALGIIGTVFGKDSPDYALILNDLSFYHHTLGNDEEAIPLIKEALGIREKAYGKEHSAYCAALCNLALYYASSENYADAIRIGTEAIGLCEKSFGKESTTYAKLLNDLSLWYKSLGDYNNAIRLVSEALTIWECKFGKMSPAYFTSLYNLASYYNLSGNYMEAIRLGTEALSLDEKLHGNKTLSYAASLNNLALYKSNFGNYTEAISLVSEALNIQKELIGKEHPDYAISLANLASYNSGLGNYVEAIHLVSEALAVFKKVYGKESSTYSIFLNSLSSYEFSLGNYSEAMRLTYEALAIQEKLFGKESPAYATTLGNLAFHNFKLGNYLEAIRIDLQVMDIRKKTLGKNHPYYASSLTRLAQDYFVLGNYNDALHMVENALKIQEMTIGKNHPEYASSLNVLAMCYSSLENYDEAIRVGEKALNITEKVFGKGHVNTSEGINNLAYYNSITGNYSEAIQLGTEALKIREKSYGKENSYYATSLNNLGKYNYYLGNYSEAIRLGTEALKILENTIGKNHPYSAKTLENLATYNWKIGSADAVGYCVEATDVLSGIVRRTFADLTARERNLFWEQYKVWFEGTIHSIAYDMPSDSLAENGYNGALMAKGLLLNSEMELSTLLKESGDSEVANIYNSLKNLRLQINKLYEMPVAERPLDTDSLERAAQGLERQLVQRSKAYGDYTANLVIDWKQVRQRLGNGEMAVEFVSFPLRNDSVMYAAYCLRKDIASPKMVPLFEERQLTSMDKRLYLSSPMLYNLIWKPLEKEMKGVTTVYFAPAGELYNLPIENLPVGEGTYNSDIRGYRRLSSTRQLALRRNGVEVAKAAVYGGLKYDTDTVTLANDSRKYRTAEPVQWSSRAVADSLGMRDGVYELPATKIEAEEIDKALETAQIDTRLYTDTIGTEASFKAMSGNGVNALHIATHGFYWTEREAAQLDGLAFLGTDMPAAVKEDKALTRSGLLFAGANTALKGLPLPEGVEDGVLTAKEIAGMDLRRLDLVALSACQTGLGEITGDGVFGLQRGFKKAGANTLLISLWKVDDTATQLLMTQFYKNLLSGMGKYEALAAAQKYLRELEVEVKPEKTAFQQIMDGKDGKKEKNPEHKTVRKYANPYYWAAFVLLDGIN
ncbi:MAG: CHAT domain-containing protein, partial [Bacteroidetes bacterium]|nr:CHAT domain-containing protein [Candidatus Limisoma faecipullorum]